ncbi:MAG: short-chain dehydrogenase [Planctomyces sp.]|nr:short-chain dehydrogenase [Planctomyces sp.]
MQLQDRVVLITGGRRLGAHLAGLVAGRGAHVAMTWFQNEEPVSEALANCRSMGVKTLAVQGDLRRWKDNQRVVAEVVKTFERIDVLVNLTSVYTRTPFAGLRPEDFDDMLDSNLRAPYYMAIEVSRQMLSQEPVAGSGLKGKIIHFTDWALDRPYRDYLPYLAAKGGLASFTKALAVELAPSITVNAVAPGTVLPPPGMSDENLEAVRMGGALERIGTPSDVNQAVLYLLEGTDFVTGETLRVDGGRFLGPPGQNNPDF